MIFSQNKEKYAFILGQVPSLSKVEIEHILNHQKIEFKELFCNDKVFVIESKKLMVDELQARLGGTIKISHIVNRISSIEKEVIEKLIHQRLQSKKKKFQFGFSLYGEVDLKEMQRIGIAVKRELKVKNVNSRFVVSKESALSSVIVQKEKLIDQGVDIVIIQSDKEYFIGYTVSVQNFQEYSDRDYGRPQRDDKSGMLPPKLAKMMLNLSQSNLDQTILDPFCGSGTVIQEALLMGYRNIIGLDISAKAVLDTKNNIEWLKTKFKQDISGVKIFEVDVKKLSEKIQPQTINCIVTEPYLGPINSNTLYNIQELENLYLKAFEQFHIVLKKEGRVVIIFPITDGQTVDILNDVKRLGFITEPLGPEPRKSVIYSRVGQRVKREIFVFKKI